MYARRLALTDLDVTGARKQVRDLMRLLVIGLAGLAAVGIVLERHRVSRSWFEETRHWGAAHALLADTGPWPLILLGIIVVGQLFAHRCRMLVGLLAAIANLILASTVLVGDVTVHLFAHVDHTSGWGVGLPFALVTLMAACIAQIAVEPWVAAAERRALEWPSPELPSAVVVRGH